MLDPQGFVSTCNSVNFFIVREKEVWVPRGKYLMQGITRKAVMDICEEHGLGLRELEFSLTQVSSQVVVPGSQEGGQVVVPGTQVRVSAGWYDAKVPTSGP